MTEFEEIYRRHYAQMYCLARVLLYDPQESKDVVSDVFARLLHGRQMPAREKTEGYLMAAVRNRCRDVLAHKSVRERVEFANDDARLLRFYFVWKPEEGLEVTLHRLNLFESVTIELTNNKIVVK